MEYRGMKRMNNQDELNFRRFEEPLKGKS